jgi:selenide,water dikinase
MMAQLQQPCDAALLVGTETSDDAGVYRLNEQQALVVTADFITPTCDDARLFGMIAAANSLSDVYAMGGRPLTALALCMFPKALEPEAAREILSGGQAKVNEAGALIVGGHTVRGEELLYGLSVTGVVDPARVIKNVGARPGDALVLTKPLGSGLILNGMRKGTITEAEARPTLEVLARLNRAASEVATSMLPRVHAMTDVTGFGLVGHALGMAAGVSLHIDVAKVPVYSHVAEMIQAGVTTGSTKPNREHGAARVRFAAAPSQFWDALVHDPQTSGGLLIAVEGGAADELVSRLHAAGVVEACRIGEVRAGDGLLEFSGAQ